MQGANSPSRVPAQAMSPSGVPVGAGLPPGVRAGRVVLLEASTFGAATNSLMIVSQLAAADIWTYLVKQGDNLSTTLTPASEGWSVEAAGRTPEGSPRSGGLGE